MAFNRIRLNQAEAEDLLENGRWGILASVSADGQPYGVPLNYVYDREAQTIYCHCAPTGQKIANITANNRISFAVVAEERILEDAFVSNYRSVIATGTAAICDDFAQMQHPLELLCARLAPTTTNEQRQAVIERYRKTVRIIAITIEQLSGKENRDS